MSDLHIKERQAYADHLYEVITSDHKAMLRFIQDWAEDQAARTDIEVIREYLEDCDVKVEDE